MKKIFIHLMPYRLKILLTTMILVVSTFCELLLPALMSEIVNKGINVQNVEVVKQLSFVMLVVAVVGGIAIVSAIRLSANFTSKFASDLRVAVFKKASSLTQDQFGKIGAGAILTRTTEDIFMIQMFMVQILRVVVSVPILIIGGSLLSFSKDVVLSLILFAFAPVVILLVYFVGKNVMPLYQKSDAYIDKQNSILRERLSGIRVIRAFVSEEREHQRAKEATETMAENIIKANVRMGAINPISMFLLNVAILLIALTGALRIQISNVSAGDVIAIIQYASLISNGLLIFSMGLIFLPRLKVTVGRINEILGIDDVVEKGFASDLKGTISFDKVSFSYEGAQEMALSDISFQVNEGETFAIVGGTGSGKSTILSLLLKFFTQTEGGIVIGGVDSSDLSASDMRRTISCALQKSTIFTGSIRENVALGKESATDEEIWTALDIAQIADFAKEKGLDYMLEQSGANLSGGQKQRLSIARGIVKNAKIFIFDDSFSALDFLTESKLRKAILENLDQKTQIVITQRIASAMNADQILVLDKGKVVGLGKHKSLLEDCTIYREIYNSQMGGAL